MSNNFLEKFAYFMIKMAKFFVKLAIFCVIIYLIGMRLFAFGHRLFYEKSMDTGDGKEIVFEIKDGDTVETIAKNLKEVGLIDDTLAFKFRAKIYKTKFTPSAYNLKTTMTIKNILDTFDDPSAEDLAVISDKNADYEPGSEGETEGENDLGSD